MEGLLRKFEARLAFGARQDDTDRIIALALGQFPEKEINGVPYGAASDCAFPLKSLWMWQSVWRRNQPEGSFV